MLFIIVVILAAAGIFLYMNTDIFSRDSNTSQQTDKSERCAEFDSRKEDKDYDFGYGDRIKQVLRGCL